VLVRVVKRIFADSVDAVSLGEKLVGEYNGRGDRLPLLMAVLDNVYTSLEAAVFKRSTAENQIRIALVFAGAGLPG
jgi:hypothetical protein